MSFSLAKYLPQAVALPVWVTLPIEKIQALPLGVSIPLVGTLAFGICQFYRFFIKPALSVAFYKRQGLIGSWSPFWGFLKQCGLDVAAKGDMYWSWKQVNHIRPKPRAFISNFAEKPVVALKDPELIRDFFAKQEQYYIKLPDAVAIPKMIVRNGRLLAEGNVWKSHSKLTAPLYSFETAKDLIPDIIKITEERWETLKTKGIRRINFMREIQHIQLEIIGRVFLGLELHKLEFKGQTVSGFVADLIDRAAVESFEPFTLFCSHKIVEAKLHPRHRKLVQDIEDLRGFLFGAAKAKLGEILADKESGASKGKRPLLLELIYEQMKKLPEGEVDAVDLVDEFANFVLGFMNTTSHANAYGSYFILANPAVHKKLLSEVDRTFKDPSSVSLDNLNEMDYMTAIMKETLRMCPPLPNLLPRVATKDHKLGDINIKAGTVISVAASTNSFDADYHDEPERFIPERWLDENSRTRKSVAKNAYVYIPFSTGHRVCAGKVLGENLYRIILSVFVKKYDFTLADKNYKISYASKLFSEPVEPLIYNIEPRLA